MLGDDRLNPACLTLASRRTLPTVEPFSLRRIPEFERQY
jgi:hypothetical protein